MQGWSFIGRFAAMSLGLISLIALAFGWITASYLTKSMLVREKVLTADYVERFVEYHIPLAKLRVLISHADSQALREVIEELLLLPEVVRIKVLDGAGTIIWSDEPAVIGMNFKDDATVQESLQGNVAVTFETMASTPENRFESGRYKRLTEIYVPIRDPASGRTLAVFELYKDLVLLGTIISRGGAILWGIALVSGAILFVGQFGLVRGVAKTINFQYRELQQRADELEGVNTRLRNTQDQLIEAERLAAIGEVTAAVAHGIRNPLSSIRLVVQEVREGLGPVHSLREPLGEIIEQVDVLEARLRSFLNTTKPFEPSLTPTRMSELVDHAIEGVRQRLGQLDVTLSIDIDAEQDGLHCDAVKIEGVVQELLVNSIDVGAHNIRVMGHRVTDDAQSAWIRLTIDDDGPGLPLNALEKVFQPFFTTKPLGTGLGMVVARKVIESHGGKLTLESHAPQGVRATVWLPGGLTNRKE